MNLFSLLSEATLAGRIDWQVVGEPTDCALLDNMHNYRAQLGDCKIQTIIRKNSREGWFSKCFSGPDFEFGLRIEIGGEVRVLTSNPKVIEGDDTDRGNILVFLLNLRDAMEKKDAVTHLRKRLTALFVS